MKKSFSKPSCEVINLDNNVILTSGCSCNVEGVDFGEGANTTCPNLNLPECTCKMNVDNPALGNCV